MTPKYTFSPEKDKLMEKRRRWENETRRKEKN